VDNKHSTKESTDDNVESPTTYGKEAYKEYRRKEKLKAEAGTLGGGYRQRKTKLAMDEQYASMIAQIFKDLKFPANKPKIIEFLMKNQPRSISRAHSIDVLSLIQQVQEKKYKSVADLTEEVGLIKDIA
jgi:hypothetical protein